MSFHVAFYFAASTIILTQTAIESVNGQCTTEGCGHDDLSMNIIREIQQEIVQASGQQNQQIQNIHDILTASFQQLTSQLNAVMRSLQAVERRLEEHDVYIKQGQSFHELLNASFQEIKSQHETVNKSFQAVDRRLLEQGQSIHVLLNESFQEIKSQQGNVITNLRAVDRSSQEHNICTKHISGIHDLLNESLKEMKGQHDTVLTKLQAAERRSQEHDICIKQSQDIREFLNESLQQTKSQSDSVNLSLQALDRRIQSYQTDIKNQTQQSWKLVNAIKNQYETINVSLQGVDRCPREHDIYSKQFHNIHEILNQSFQEIRNHHDSVESRICINQNQSIHELINVSLHEIKNQHDTVLTSFQAFDRRLQQHDVTMRLRTQNLWRLTNGTCESTSQVCDCSYLKASGLKTSGVYEVCVRHQTGQMCSNAFCDMEATNGASLVFQRRKDGIVNFNRTWAEYRKGFGNPDGEFWLGNEMLYLLTSKRKYKLRVDLEDWEGAKRYAEYARFFISSSSNNYRLTIGNYSGNAGDGLTYSHNGKQFTTNDADNDEDGGNCALKYGGGWWYGNNCFWVNLNGIYRQRYETFSIWMGIHWLLWPGFGSGSLKSTEMKLVAVA